MTRSLKNGTVSCFWFIFQSEGKKGSDTGLHGFPGNKKRISNACCCVLGTNQLRELTNGRYKWWLQPNAVLTIFCHKQALIVCNSKPESQPEVTTLITEEVTVYMFILLDDKVQDDYMMLMDAADYMWSSNNSWIHTLTSNSPLPSITRQEVFTTALPALLEHPMTQTALRLQRWPASETS